MAALFIWLCTPGLAQTVAEAEAALVNGAPVEALDILDRLEVDPADDPLQILFIEGLAAMDAGQFQRAIRALEAMVTAAPDLTRPRLELARAYFLAGDDGNAMRQFELVTGGITDLAVLDTIEQFLAEIEARRTLWYSFSIGLAPDTNINAATDAATVDLAFIGLPFDVPADARAQSGTGLETSLGLDWRGRPDEVGGRWTAGATLFAREYSDDRFDDRLIDVTLGRQVRLSDWTLTFGPKALIRQSGGAVSERGYGLRLQGTHTPRATRQLSFSLGKDWDHNLLTDRRMARASASAGIVEALSGRTRAGVTLSLDRYHGEATTEARGVVGLTGLFYTEFADGLTVALRPRVSLAVYDQAVNGISGNRRRDITYGLPVEVSHRRLRIAGFQPYGQITWEQRDSVNPFFEYDRQRVFAGVSRRF
ncbi:hypothetical protein FHS89_002322 [Rubricella aquisinus]|uniref:Surface lipoprotein assembly modifier C-terminal domain-containing protein n=1 Tax=Rubricella aquisinus TaxID=2028108 RepID=A0A840X393_9RHOB|nr:surface lipoprotein assembly modifier [Rubricella aquisinus]MBB5516296.1 hypothetical protein [Rubricella aquisinus]